MKKTLFIMLLLSCAACKKDKNNNNDQTIDPDKDAPKITKEITTTGGDMALENVVNLTFPEGTFTTPNKVTIIKSSDDNDVKDYYESSAILFGSESRSAYFVKINSGQQMPLKTITASLKIPAELTASLKAGYKFEVMALINQSGDDESIISFEPIESVYTSSSGMMSIVIPNYYFDNTSTTDQSWEVVLVLTTMPGQNQGGRLQEDECAGFYVRCPLEKCVVTSPFDTTRLHPVLKIVRPHNGVDLRAAEKTPVYAAYDGKVAEVREQKNKKTGKYTGYGIYVTIVHINDAKQRIATRYAHLNSASVKVGQAVKEGDQIALSGNTGIGTAPHLHFEYAINANTGNYNQRIDPIPMINTTSVRLLSAKAALTGINNCSNDTRSTWNVNFDYRDPSNNINKDATLTFQDIEPVVNPPYTVDASALNGPNGLVTSPTFCAHFSDYTYFKIKVYMTIGDVRSNCIYFYLNKSGGALRLIEKPSAKQEHIGSSK
jgi:hypothetical protein